MLWLRRLQAIGILRGVTDNYCCVLQAQRDTCASPEAPPADAPSPPAEATPEDPPAEAPEPPPLHTDSDAEEGINVDVNVKAPRGMFFVRLTLQVGL